MCGGDVMCSLFGMIDYGKAISETQKMKLIKTLSICCEKRGTDATGIAFITENRIQIKKKAVPARKFRFKLPRNTSVGAYQINHARKCLL